MDISATDQTFKNFTSLADNNSTMNFALGFQTKIDINDNEYIRIRAYSLNDEMKLTLNSILQMKKCQ